MDKPKTEKPTRPVKKNYNKTGKLLAKRQRKRQEAIDRFKVNVDTYEKAITKATNDKKLAQDKKEKKLLELNAKLGKVRVVIETTQKAITDNKKY
jgi:hypothetical protein